MNAGGRARWLLVLMLAGLQGCAIIGTPAQRDPGVADPAAWQARQTRLAELDGWSLQGRAATGKLLGWTGNLSWRQRGEEFRIRLAGPLGAGGFRADGTLERVRIRTSQETFHTEMPEVLVAEILGWRFPLTGLRYWALGLPEPGKPANLTVDDNGLLIGLEQAGWRLDFPAYEAHDGLALPKRITLTDDEHTIQLVVDRWFDLSGGEIESASGES